MLSTTESTKTSTAKKRPSMKSATSLFYFASCAIAAAAFTPETLPGAVPPLGFFDPLGFAAKADVMTLKRYREAEITHGRVAMLASVGFLVGEKVEGSSFLFDASVSGPAITHLTQVPTPFWTALLIVITNAELYRARRGWVEPVDVPADRPGLLRDDYIPGDLAWDPLGLKPQEPAQFEVMQAKELQNGRLAMIAAAGFMAQELVDGKGIMEHLQSA
jgi:Chlorophyll A-B binding protein